MKLHSIDAGHFKLDGGSMFGVVPKVLWQKLTESDANNHVPLAMRCLLIETSNRLILVDCGMGDKQDARWQRFYYRHGEGDLVRSIQKAGFDPSEITDVLLSHLHFDHCGGAVQWNSRKDGYELTFAHAHYWTHSDHWAWALKPNAREKSTFLKENLLPMQESGQLKFVDQEPFGTEIELLTMNGHTEKMLLPKMKVGEQTIVFTADLLPTSAHVPVNYVMSYDIRPLDSMTEKEQFYEKAIAENWILFSDHDPVYEALTIQSTEKGYRLKEAGRLIDFL